MAKLSLKWTKTAARHLQAVSDYLVNQDRPETARNIILKILNGIEQIRSFPESGRKGRVDGTFELVIPGTPFNVIYCHRKGAIIIISILHQAKAWI